MMWSKPFFVKQQDGTEVAVILMHTKGLFHESKAREMNEVLFGIVSLLSTVLIYSGLENNETDIDALRKFTDFTQKEGQIGNDVKPFQVCAACFLTKLQFPILVSRVSEAYFCGRNAGGH